MEEFIRQSNIRQFRKQLAECTDAAQRKILERLLQEQESLGQPGIQAAYKGSI